MKKQYIEPTCIIVAAVGSTLMAISDTKGDAYKESEKTDIPQPGGNGDGSDYSKQHNSNLWDDED